MSAIGEKLAEKHGDNAIHNFTIGNPRVPPPAEYCAALREVAEQEIPLCHGYSSTMGDLNVRQRFAEILSKLQDTHVGPEHIIMSSGCAGALNVTLRTILSSGDEVILVAPYFLEYPFYVENYHCRPVILDTKFEEGWQINAEQLEDLINAETRAIIINSPHNPTGIIYTQDTINKMCEVLKRKSDEYGRPIYIISDDVYARVVPAGIQTHLTFKNYSYSVVCYSLSKDLSLPGERIGAVCANPLLENVGLLVTSLAHANEILGFVHTNRVGMRAAAKCLPCISQIELYDQSREIICNLFDELGIQYVKPSGAFYVFPKVPDGINEFEFCKTMAENFIIVVPGSGFGAQGFFRVSFCKPPHDIARAVPVFKTAYAAALKLKKE